MGFMVALGLDYGPFTYLLAELWKVKQIIWAWYFLNLSGFNIERIY